MNLDKKNPDKIAVVDDTGAELTYGDICAFGGEFSKVLPRRTLIFILARNSVGSLLGYTASLSNRIVPLVLSANTERGLLEHLLNVYCPEYLWMPEDKQVDFGFDMVYMAHGYVLLKTGWQPPALHDELALLLPTSGSTGSPKLVRHSYRNIEANAMNVSYFFRITPEERAMAILPMHYTMGLSVIASHLVSGAMVLLCGKSLLDKGFWSILKEKRATSFTGVPYSYEILNKMRFFRMELPDLKIITQGGGKLEDGLYRACVDYAEKFGKRFIPTYGQTEGTARMAYLEPEMAKYKIGSIGKAEPNGKLSIVSDEGVETFEGEAEGEMVYRGENVTLGYATSADDLVKDDENHGVLYTGDIVRRDADGYYFVVGRKKRFLKIFGLRIGLDEVEHLVKSAFDTDCLCGGTDELLTVRITNAQIVEQVRDFIVEKTKLFHKNFEVLVVDKINRNEAGKAVLNN